MCVFDTKMVNGAEKERKTERKTDRKTQKDTERKKERILGDGRCSRNWVRLEQGGK